jgi:hypothetical protein
LQAIFAPIAKELERTKQQLILNWLERKENLKKLVVITNPTLNWQAKHDLAQHLTLFLLKYLN